MRLFAIIGFVAVCCFFVFLARELVTYTNPNAIVLGYFLYGLVVVAVIGIIALIVGHSRE